MSPGQRRTRQLGWVLALLLWSVLVGTIILFFAA
jgi:hypothetical protein